MGIKPKKKLFGASFFTGNTGENVIPYRQKKKGENPMRIMIIRHGDPNYDLDVLTERGKLEAAALAKWLTTQSIDDIYVSPLGRAQETAAFTLEALGKTAETMDWLEEFPATVRLSESETLMQAMPLPWADRPDDDRFAWDILPGYWMNEPNYFDREKWRDTELCRHSDMIGVYDRVVRGLEELLARYDIYPEGGCWRVEKSTHRTAALFCHFGVECVLLSRLLGISPFPLWHGFVSLTSGVTLVNTEERKKGIANFRTAYFGDLSHLALAGIEPNFSGRYCECFEDETRH